jgi:adenine deaminase
MIRILTFIFLPALAAFSQAPDIIYYNAAIITMSPAHPTAQAVAIRGDRFVAVGSNADVLKAAGPRTQKIDIGGKCMVPGPRRSPVHTSPVISLRVANS